MRDKERDAFEELFTQWHEQAQYHSDGGSEPNIRYERIIQLGYNVVPYIIDKLRKKPEHLFIALVRITGENPVKEEHRGKVKEMAEDWVRWWDGRTNGAGLSLPNMHQGEGAKE
jgi:hypothetical protein